LGTFDVFHAAYKDGTLLQKLGLDDNNGANENAAGSGTSSFF
jgi:hypothetical protein